MVLRFLCFEHLRPSSGFYAQRTSRGGTDLARWIVVEKLGGFGIAPRNCPQAALLNQTHRAEVSDQAFAPGKLQTSWRHLPYMSVPLVSN